MLPEGDGRRPVEAAQQPVRSVWAPGFVLTSQAARDTAEITVAGELTMVSAVLLDAEMAHLYGPETARDLVLDLTDVTFLDVMGLASLRRVHERALQHGRLRIGLPASGGPRRLLALAVEHGWISSVFDPGGHFIPTR
jgi:anti-anti-sigma factor